MEYLSEGRGYRNLLLAIVKQSIFDIWEYNRPHRNGIAQTYRAIKTREYYARIRRNNYDTAKEFILKFFGKEMLGKLEKNGKPHHQRKALEFISRAA